MRFAKGAKGIALDNEALELKVVDVVDGDWQAAGVIVHDATNRSVAHMLHAMRLGECPMAPGALSDDPRPTFEADAWRQNDAAAEGKTADPPSLPKQGPTWKVTTGGPYQGLCSGRWGLGK